jgi:hypothetical protein
LCWRSCSGPEGLRDMRSTPNRSAHHRQLTTGRTLRSRHPIA